MGAAEAGERLARFERAVARLDRPARARRDRRSAVRRRRSSGPGSSAPPSRANWPAIDCAPSCWSGPTTSAPAPRRPTPPSCTPASTPSPAASSPPWSDRGHTLLSAYAGAAGIALEQTGAVLVAWNAEQAARLDDVLAKARANGYERAARMTLDELYPARAPPRPRGDGGRRHPRRIDHLSRGARASRSPPKRSVPASSSASGPPVDRCAGAAPTTGWLHTSAGPDPGRLGGQRGRARRRISSTGASATTSSPSRPGGASSSSSTSWPARLVSSIVLPVPDRADQGRPGGADGVRQRAARARRPRTSTTAEDTATTAPGLDGLLERGSPHCARAGRRGGHGDVRRRARRHRAPGLPDHRPRAMSTTPASVASGPPA